MSLEVSEQQDAVCCQSLTRAPEGSTEPPHRPRSFPTRRITRLLVKVVHGNVIIQSVRGEGLCVWSPTRQNAPVVSCRLQSRTSTAVARLLRPFILSRVACVMPVRLEAGPKLEWSCPAQPRAAAALTEPRDGIKSRRSCCASSSHSCRLPVLRSRAVRHVTMSAKTCGQLRPTHFFSGGGLQPY